MISTVGSEVFLDRSAKRVAKIAITGDPVWKVKHASRLSSLP